ncbi:MAG: DnaJ domain-containing protein [Bacteroidales bacterium]|nr:DnaJ domain-containing protein [Bacteroidales bacterium]
MGIGKWILTGLGWTMMGPVGAIIGYIVGKKLENESDDRDDQRIGGGYSNSSSTNQKRSYQRYQNTGNDADLSAALLVLIADVMNADNVVKKSELDIVKRFLLSNYGEEKGKELLLRLRDLKDKKIPTQDVCRQIKINTDYTTRYHMLDFLFSIAGSDGDVSSPELLLLHSISNGLGIRMSDYLSISSRHTTSSYRHSDSSSRGGSYRSSSSRGNTTSSGKDPYSVLGINSSATDDEVKKAYRRMAMKYHPDKVEGLGDEVKRNAEAQFREINEAYETIKQARGMK